MDATLAMSAGAQVGYLSLALVALAVVVGFVLIASVDAWGAIGKGPFSMEHGKPPSRSPGPADAAREAAERELELRQMLAAKAERMRRRGEPPLDVEAELERLLASGAGGTGQALADLVGSRR